MEEGEDNQWVEFSDFKDSNNNQQAPVHSSFYVK